MPQHVQVLIENNYSLCQKQGYLNYNRERQLTDYKVTNIWELSSLGIMKVLQQAIINIFETN